MEKQNGFGIWSRHKCLKNLVNLHEGGEAVVLLLRLFLVLTLTQLGTNAYLQKSFKHTTDSLSLKARSCRMCSFIFMLLCSVLFYFCVTEPGALPKPVRFGFLSQIWQEIYQFTLLLHSQLLFRLLLRSGCPLATGTMWTVSKSYHSPRLLQITEREMLWYTITGSQSGLGWKGHLKLL